MRRVLSLWQLADMLSEMALKKDTAQRKNCDFFVAGGAYEKAPDPETIRQDESWYGVRFIRSGFDSDAAEMLINYYGGGSGVYLEIEPDDMRATARADIFSALLKSLSVRGESVTTADRTFVVLEEREEKK